MNGIPQGSPLSVVLFLIDFNKLSSIINEHKYFQHIMYADDLCMCSIVKKVNTLEFSNYDIILLTLLSEGILQKNIPQILQQRNINPNSLSSVEKRISIMKIAMDVKNNEQLIARCKDLGII